MPLQTWVPASSLSLELTSAEQPQGGRPGGGGKLLHPRSHPHGGSEPSAGLGLPAGAKARAKALGLGFCESQVPSCEGPLHRARCALPSMVPIIMPVLEVEFPARCSVPPKPGPPVSPAQVLGLPFGLRRVNSLHGTAPPGWLQPRERSSKTISCLWALAKPTVTTPWV